MANPNRRPPEVTRTVTHEGAAAWSPDVFSELEFTAATTFLGEKTFYERADKREDRLINLVHEAIKRNPARTALLIAKVRSDYRIRTAALLMAVEYVAAHGPDARGVVDSVIQRPDETSGILALWQRRYGGRGRNKGTRDLSNLPQALRKGVADAIVRQLTERNYLKWKGGDRQLVTMADAIELTHPKFGYWKETVPGEGPLPGEQSTWVYEPQEWKHELVRYILDEAHHGDGIDRYIQRRQGSSESPELPMIYRSYQLGQMPEGARRGWLDSTEDFEAAGYTWERLSGWLPGGMDAGAWTGVIPNMGVMALLRNLRNFDNAGISTEAQALVEAKITDLAEVARSRIFPYRVWQAYKAAPSDRWKHPLATTLDLSVGNLPSFDRTLFLVDVSASMQAPVSNLSNVQRYELATLMGALAFKGSTNSTLAFFAVESAAVQFERGISTLAMVADLVRGVEAHINSWGWRQLRNTSDPFHFLGQGTNLHTALHKQFDPDRHDRAVVFTDEQSMDDARLSDHIPQVTFFNLAGYAAVTDWGKGRLHVPGFSDAAFRAVAELTR